MHERSLQMTSLLQLHQLILLKENYVLSETEKELNHRIGLTSSLKEGVERTNFEIVLMENMRSAFYNDLLRKILY